MKYKSKKFYGICLKNSDTVGVYANKETAVDALDTNWPTLIELTVTKVFTRETDIQEIEKE